MTTATAGAETPTHPSSPHATGKRQSLTERAFWLMAAKTLAFAFAFALPLLLTRRLTQALAGAADVLFRIDSIPSRRFRKASTSAGSKALPRCSRT